MSRLLFPEIIPVTQAEIDAWLDEIPRLSSAEFRRKAYAKAYHVEDKIRAMKAALSPIQTSLIQPL